MNYDQVIAKVKRLEETVDLILLNMCAKRPDTPAEEYLLSISNLRDKAERRQISREAECKAREEHMTLKRRITELEYDYPSLRSKE